MPDKRDREAISQLLASPGWAIVQKMAEKRIADAKLLALIEQDETKFLDVYRRCHAAQNALIEFIADLSGLAEETNDNRN